MKMVINGTYGGFELPEDYAAVKTEGFVWDCSDDIRRDFDLIDIVESDDYDGDLEVVEIPEEATDYYIEEYDGAESVIFVVDGKIHFA